MGLEWHDPLSKISYEICDNEPEMYVKHRCMVIHLNRLFSMLKKPFFPRRRIPSFMKVLDHLIYKRRVYQPEYFNNSMDRIASLVWYLHSFPELRRFHPHQDIYVCSDDPETIDMGNTMRELTLYNRRNHI